MPSRGSSDDSPGGFGHRNLGDNLRNILGREQEQPAPQQGEPSKEIPHSLSKEQERALTLDEAKVVMDRELREYAENLVSGDPKRIAPFLKPAKDSAGNDLVGEDLADNLAEQKQHIIDLFTHSPPEEHPPLNKTPPLSDTPEHDLLRAIRKYVTDRVYEVMKTHNNNQNLPIFKVWDERTTAWADHVTSDKFSGKTWVPRETYDDSHGPG